MHRTLDGRVDRRLATPTPRFAALADEPHAALAEFRLRGASRRIGDAVAALNADLTATEPWRLAKDPAKRDELAVVLGRQLGAARAIAAATEPIVPDLFARLRQQLGGADQQLPEP